MSLTYSPAPSESELVGLPLNSCTCSKGSPHAIGECLKIRSVKYGEMGVRAPLTPQPSPTRRRPEEAILMDDLRRVREEMRNLREELQKMRDERDRWRNQNHGMPLECYEIIKQHGLQSGERIKWSTLCAVADNIREDLSLTTLQHLDTRAAVERLERHEQHMEYLFAKKSCDLAANVQTIIVEIQFVKTNLPGDTLRWRLYSALKVMSYVSKGLQDTVRQLPQTESTAPGDSKLLYDDYLRSTLKSADVQLLSILNEIRERNMHDYYLAFRERFAPEYDLIHNRFGVDFYEKTKTLMVHMYTKRRAATLPPAGAATLPPQRLDEVVCRREDTEEDEVEETTWI